MKIYDHMGANLSVKNGCAGVQFRVFAPRAQSVSVIGDFNQWTSTSHPMDKEGGTFSLFVPDLKEGDRYQYAIIAADGRLLIKSDPYGKLFEKRPDQKSLIADPDQYQFSDDEWMSGRENPKHRPLNVYEVHLGSWMRERGNFLNYRQLARRLSSYAKEMHYTHVELLPVCEHPLDESWGYQVTGFYAPTSRFGTVEDFQYFVDHMHREGIGVLLDWVPGHFPIDDHALSYFDGEPLFEKEDPIERLHPEWTTHVFDYSRKEVREFLIGSALYFFDKMHIDGIRVDAVTSMLYLDYGRKEGEWTPNKEGGKENLEAIAFLRELNESIHREFPDALVIAEDSSHFPGVTTPADQGGLGFDMKWNLGWMNDTLSFFRKNVSKRHLSVNKVHHTFSFAHNENFLLPLSHDEVVHGKGSLIEKMPGNETEKFQSLRLLMSFKMCYPGKKLLFMGSEMAHFSEWDSSSELHWSLKHLNQNKTFQDFIKRLNAFYLENPPLWEKDFSKEGFEEIQPTDYTGSTAAFYRYGGEKTLLCLHNFSDTAFTLDLPKGRDLKLLFCSNGEGPKVIGELPGLTTLVYEVLGDKGRVSQAH